MSDRHVPDIALNTQMSLNWLRWAPPARRLNGHFQSIDWGRQGRGGPDMATTTRGSQHSQAIRRYGPGRSRPYSADASGHMGCDQATTAAETERRVASKHPMRWPTGRADRGSWMLRHWDTRGHETESQPTGPDHSAHRHPRTIAGRTLWPPQTMLEADGSHLGHPFSSDATRPRVVCSRVNRRPLSEMGRRQHPAHDRHHWGGHQELSDVAPSPQNHIPHVSGGRSVPDHSRRADEHNQVTHQTRPRSTHRDVDIASQPTGDPRSHSRHLSDVHLHHRGQTIVPIPQHGDDFGPHHGHLGVRGGRRPDHLSTRSTGLHRTIRLHPSDAAGLAHTSAGVPLQRTDHEHLWWPATSPGHQISSPIRIQHQADLAFGTMGLADDPTAPDWGHPGRPPTPGGITARQGHPSSDTTWRGAGPHEGGDPGWPLGTGTTVSPTTPADRRPEPNTAVGGQHTLPPARRTRRHHPSVGMVNTMRLAVRRSPIYESSPRQPILPDLFHTRTGRGHWHWWQRGTIKTVRLLKAPGQRKKKGPCRSSNEFKREPIPNTIRIYTEELRNHHLNTHRYHYDPAELGGSRAVLVRRTDHTTPHASSCLLTHHGRPSRVRWATHRSLTHCLCSCVASWARDTTRIHNAPAWRVEHMGVSQHPPPHSCTSFNDWIA